MSGTEGQPPTPGELAWLQNFERERVASLSPSVEAKKGPLERLSRIGSLVGPKGSEASSLQRRFAYEQERRGTQKPLSPVHSPQLRAVSSVFKEHLLPCSQLSASKYSVLLTEANEEDIHLPIYSPKRQAFFETQPFLSFSRIKRHNLDVLLSRQELSESVQQQLLLLRTEPDDVLRAPSWAKQSALVGTEHSHAHPATFHSGRSKEDLKAARKGRHDVRGELQHNRSLMLQLQKVLSEDRLRQRERLTQIGAEEREKLRLMRGVKMKPFFESQFLVPPAHKARVLEPAEDGGAFRFDLKSLLRQRRR